MKANILAADTMKFKCSLSFSLNSIGVGGRFGLLQNSCPSSVRWSGGKQNSNY